MPRTVPGTGERAKNKNRHGTSFHDAHSLVGTQGTRPLLCRSDVLLDLGRIKELNRAVI